MTTDDLIARLRAGTVTPEICEAAAVALEQIADCNEYLKEGETPRQRMDRDHKDVLALMEMLAKDRKDRDEARATIREMALQALSDDGQMMDKIDELVKENEELKSQIKWLQGIRDGA